MFVVASGGGGAAGCALGATVSRQDRDSFSLVRGDNERRVQSR